MQSNLQLTDEEGAGCAGRLEPVLLRRVDTVQDPTISTGLVVFPITLSQLSVVDPGPRGSAETQPDPVFQIPLFSQKVLNGLVVDDSQRCSFGPAERRAFVPGQPRPGQEETRLTKMHPAGRALLTVRTLGLIFEEVTLALAEAAL